MLLQEHLKAKGRMAATTPGSAVGLQATAPHGAPSASGDHIVGAQEVEEAPGPDQSPERVSSWPLGNEPAVVSRVLRHIQNAVGAAAVTDSIVDASPIRLDVYQGGGVRGGGEILWPRTFGEILWPGT
jgi:hypothetical protein